MILLKIIWWVVKYGFMGIICLISWPVGLSMYVYEETSIDRDAGKGLIVLSCLGMAGWLFFLLWSAFKIWGSPCF